MNKYEQAIEELKTIYFAMPANTELSSHLINRLCEDVKVLDELVKQIEVYKAPDGNEMVVLREN